MSLDALHISTDKKVYIMDKLQPTLEDMVTEVITQMPDDPIVYMRDFLNRKIGSSKIEDEVFTLRAELDQKEKQLASARKSLLVEHHSLGDVGFVEESESDSDDEDDYVDELPANFRQTNAGAGKARCSVSAEVYGNWNQKKAFNPPVSTKENSNI